MDVKAIDGHRHVLLQEAIAAGCKLNPVKSSHIYPTGLNERSEQINSEKGGAWDRKMSNLDGQIRRSERGGDDDGCSAADPRCDFFDWTKPFAASELSRMVNEFTAKEVRRRPDQIVGLATVPLQDVDLAVRALHAVQNLGLRGAVMGSNVNGHGFDEEVFQPFFAKVEELDVPRSFIPAILRGSRGSVIITSPISWVFLWNPP